MRLSLPHRTPHDNTVWGFRPDFDDEAYFRSKDSPGWDESFGDADHPVPDGRRLDVIVRELCKQADVCQPFVRAKRIGETSFLSAQVPPGKRYDAPLGFDCPSGQPRGETHRTGGAAPGALHRPPAHPAPPRLSHYPPVGAARLGHRP